MLLETQLFLPLSNSILYYSLPPCPQLLTMFQPLQPSVFLKHTLPTLVLYTCHLFCLEHSLHCWFLLVNQVSTHVTFSKTSLTM